MAFVPKHIPSRAEVVAEALTLFIGAGGEVNLREEPPQGVYSTRGETRRTVAFELDARAFDDVLADVERRG